MMDESGEGQTRKKKKKKKKKQTVPKKRHKDPLLI
jgi:hypothetical protein